MKTTLCWFAFITSKLLRTYPFNKVISKDRNRTCRWSPTDAEVEQHLSLGNDNPPGMVHNSTTSKGEATSFSKYLQTHHNLAVLHSKTRCISGTGEYHGEGQYLGKVRGGAYSTYTHKNQGRCNRFWVVLFRASKFTLSESKKVFFHIVRLATFAPNSQTLSPNFRVSKCHRTSAWKDRAAPKQEETAQGCFSHGFGCGMWCISAFPRLHSPIFFFSFYLFFLFYLFTFNLWSKSLG